MILVFKPPTRFPVRTSSRLMFAVKNFPPILLLCLCAFGTLALLTPGADAAPASPDSLVNPNRVPPTPAAATATMTGPPQPAGDEDLVVQESDLDLDAHHSDELEGHLDGPEAHPPAVTHPAKVAEKP